MALEVWNVPLATCTCGYLRAWVCDSYCLALPSTPRRNRPLVSADLSMKEFLNVCLVERSPAMFCYVWLPVEGKGDALQ